MHDLYLHYLSCKGKWKACSLVMSVKKTNGTDFIELYEFWSKTKMEAELGPELAQDLIKRHTDAEDKLPTKLKGKFIRKKLAWNTCTFSWESQNAPMANSRPSNLCRAPRESEEP